LATTLKAPAETGTSFGAGLVIPGAREEAVVAFEVQVVDFFVSAADLLGVPKSVAAIYGIIFASPVPLSFAEIEARLDISKGSVSQGLRVLREVGAIKPAANGQRATSSADESSSSEILAAEGSKLRAPVAYVPDLALRKLVARFLEHRLEKQLTAGSSRLTALSRAIPGKGAEAAELKQRLQSLSDWHSKARTLLPLARTVLKIGG
jgi:DNA-binding transcriptional ArsR family regulator